MNKKVLLVDNNPSLLNLLKKFLVREGHHVVTAEDGLSALDALETFRPDVIFIDIVMPNIDGIQLCQVIRSRPELKDVYLVVLSGVAMEDRLNLDQVDADAFIAKSQFQKTLTHILTAIDEAGNHRALSSPEKLRGTETCYPREATKELLATKKHFEAILEGMAEGVVELNPEGRVTYANPIASSILKVPQAELMGQQFTNLFPGVDENCIKQILSVDIPATEQANSMSPIQLNGRSITLSPVPIESNGTKAAVFFRDITERTLAEEALRQSEAQYRGIFNSALDGMIIFDFYGNLIDANPQACKMYGYSYEEILQCTGKDLVHPSYHEQARNFQKTVHSTGELHGESLDVRKDGSLFNTEIKGSIIKYEGNQLLSVTVRDITERKQAEEKLHKANSDAESARQELKKMNNQLEAMNKELQKQTFIDGLTGIANRRYFDQVLDKEWRRAQRQQKPLSFIMADIDFFKNYNDTYGHQEGDECLKKIAKTLSLVARRPADLVARYGGEEFAIVLPNTSPEDAYHLAEMARKAILALEIPHISSDTCEYATISLGVGFTTPQRNQNPQQLIEVSDKLLYQAKRSGRNKTEISKVRLLFNPRMHVPKNLKHDVS